MKSFIAACILLAVITLFLLVSAPLLEQEAGRLSEKARALSELPLEERAEPADAFAEEWESRQLLFFLFVNENEFSRLGTALARAQASAEIKSDSDFQIAVAEVAEELDKLRELVGLRAENIF